MAVGPVTDEIVSPLLVSLVGCLTEWFAVALSPITKVGLRHGADYAPLIGGAGQDEACPGLVWVRWVGAGDASRGFPSIGGQASPCGPGIWGVGVEVGVVRCAKQWPVNGGLPTQDTWNAVTLLALADAATVRQAVNCCVTAPTAPASWRSVSWGQAAPMAIDGNAAGFTQQITVPVLESANCQEC